MWALALGWGRHTAESLTPPLGLTGVVNIQRHSEAGRPAQLGGSSTVLNCTAYPPPVGDATCFLVVGHPVAVSCTQSSVAILYFQVRSPMFVGLWRRVGGLGSGGCGAHAGPLVLGEQVPAAVFPNDNVTISVEVNMYIGSIDTYINPFDVNQYGCCVGSCAVTLFPLNL